MLAYRVLIPIGILSLIVGIVIASISSLLLDLILQQTLVLSPTSKVWVKAIYYMYIRVFAEF